MSDVTPVNGAPAAALHIGSRLRAADSPSEPGPVRTTDKVELSRAATFISQLLSKNEVRQDLVNRVRDEIAKGAYETPEKIETVVSELLSDLSE